MVVGATMSLVALAAGVLFCFDPNRYPFYPLCFFHRATGLLCPGCGSLRALHQLLHGNLATAFHFNALLVSSHQEPALSAELRHELASADRVDLLCAFVRWSGIRVLLPELRAARARGVPVRVITTTYTGSTETRALDELRDLGAEIRVSYDTGSTRKFQQSFRRQTGHRCSGLASRSSWWLLPFIRQRKAVQW